MTIWLALLNWSQNYGNGLFGQFRSVIDTGIFTADRRQYFD